MYVCVTMVQNKYVRVKQWYILPVEWKVMRDSSRTSNTWQTLKVFANWVSKVLHERNTTIHRKLSIVAFSTKIFLLSIVTKVKCRWSNGMRWFPFNLQNCNCYAIFWPHLHQSRFSKPLCQRFWQKCCQ